MTYRPENPLIIQGDYSVLAEAFHPGFEGIRGDLGVFADLEKSPEHIHTYRITPLSLWNAASAGQKASDIIIFLEKHAKFPLPENVRRGIGDYISRYGLVKLLPEPPPLSTPGEQSPAREPGDWLYLYSHDAPTIAAIAGHKETKGLFTEQPNEFTLQIAAGKRGIIKQLLIRIGYPVEDLAGYVDGDALSIVLRETALSGQPFIMRNYQRQAVDIFHAQGRETGGSGVLVLPCGAGKTIIGIGAMAEVGMNTLILTTSNASAHQWIREMLDKTTLTADQIGEYSSQDKTVRPVTVTTYQMVTYRSKKDGQFPHFELFNASPWGLIIYDEVHTLPAPVFQVTAELQALRRLGLTATLVREDGRESDVFTLIGPKKYDVPWREMEAAGWIAPVQCTEVRVPMDFSLRMECAQTLEKQAWRLEAENPSKLEVVRRLVARHQGESILVIGQYIKQLEVLSAALAAPLLTGKTSAVNRDTLYEDFRQGNIPVLVVSKVANFSIDLPDASVAIQVSGAFGSRQEEAQRLGRILRPKSDGRSAHFYTVVSKDSREQEFAHHRQLFLAEQGYCYDVIDADAIEGDLDDETPEK